MALAPPPELFQLVPVYTKDGRHYGYVLSRVNLDGKVVVFKENVDQIGEAARMIEDHEDREEAFFQEAAAEARNPNR